MRKGHTNHHAPPRGVVRMQVPGRCMGRPRMQVHGKGVSAGTWGGPYTSTSLVLAYTAEQNCRWFGARLQPSHLGLMRPATDKSQAPWSVCLATSRPAHPSHCSLRFIRRSSELPLASHWMRRCLADGFGGVRPHVTGRVPVITRQGGDCGWAGLGTLRHGVGLRRPVC